MTLSEVLEALGAEMPERQAWAVAILTRKGEDGSVGEEVREYPIFDVFVDAADEEINLL